MKLYLNGSLTEIKSGTTLKELLEKYQINPNTVVIEYNESVVARNTLGATSLQDGDKVEIVQFVGGGKDEDPAEARAPKPRPRPRAKKASSSSSNGPKNLVIVESPAKAKTIHKFLGADFQVEASMGHVRDLPKSKMGLDIEHNFTPEYIVIAKARKTVSRLKKVAKGKQGIYLAPDPDREGEAISWHLSYLLSEQNGDSNVHRVSFNEITKEAVQAAFSRPRKIDMNLVNAQQARRILDRLVGYELSPLLWRKVGRGLSAGRVQSVALRLIVDREREVKAFLPQEYWTIEAKLSSEREENQGKFFLAKLDKIGEEKVELKDRDQTEKIRREILASSFQVQGIERKERTRRPQAPYTTSKLQQEAYNRLGFPAAKTMRVAQRLYEGVELGKEGSVGIITYLRTDSVSVATSAQNEARDYVGKKFGGDYLPKEPPVYRSKKGAQEAHEAIRPTSVRREPEQMKQYLDDDEYKLYDLIWRKFVASQMMPAVDEQITAWILAGEKYFFKATGRRNLFPGFGILYQTAAPAKSEEKSERDEKEDSDELDSATLELPALVQGETLKLHELLGLQHFTKPPARYNDASLVKTLEEKGIGRPSTYAPTIYTLLDREYVNRQGGALIPTELGETVADLLVKHFPKIIDEQFTALMEGELDRIEDGEIDWISVIKEFYGPFEIDMATARKEMANVRQEAVPTEYTCDVCGKVMVIKWGRFGKFLACSGFPDCKYTRSMPTGFRCPQPECGGDLVKRMSKKRRTFYGCSNYPRCTYIANKLPRQGEQQISEDDKLADNERQVLGP